MATFQEIEQALQKAVDAARDLRGVINEAHGIKKDLDKTMRAQQQRITDEIVAEVARQVTVIAAEAREEMRAKMADVIDGLAAEWRGLLGLP